MKQFLKGFLLMAALLAAAEGIHSARVQIGAQAAAAVLPEALLLKAAQRAGWRPEEMRISFWGEGEDIQEEAWLAGLIEALSDVLTEAWVEAEHDGGILLRYEAPNIQGTAAVYPGQEAGRGAGTFDLVLPVQDPLSLPKALRSYLEGTLDRFEVFVAVNGYVPGDWKHRRFFAKTLLAGLGARIQTSIQDSNFAYYSGYSATLGALYGQGYPTNGEAAFRYDEGAGHTRIWLGVPLIPGSY